MAKELTDLKLSKIKVGFKSEFLGDVAKNREKIYISGGLFVQLGLRCHTFRYIYRDRDGVSRQISIGRFDPNGDGQHSFNIDQAIAAYSRIIDKRNRGIDPREALEQQRQEEERRRARRELLFGSYANAWLEKKISSGEVTSPDHKAKLESYFNVTLNSILNTPLVDITEDRIRRIFDDTLALSTNQQDKINRINRLLHHLFHDALKERLIDSDPMLGIYPEDYPAPKRGSYKHINDLTTLKKFLQALPKVKGEPSTIAMVRIAPHLFTRPVEIRLLKWENVNFENSYCVLHKAKTRGQSINDGGVNERPTDFIIPLSKPVKIILQQLQTITGNKEYVFSGRFDDNPISENTAGKALRTALEKEGLGHLTSMHGFRYTARSLIPGILRIPKRIVEQQMSHATAPSGEEAAQSDDRYGYDQYLYLPERRAMMDIWSEFLEGIASDIFQELTAEEVRLQCESGQMTRWQVFVEELREKYKRLCGIYQQAAQ